MKRTRIKLIGGFMPTYKNKSNRMKKMMICVCALFLMLSCAPSNKKGNESNNKETQQVTDDMHNASNSLSYGGVYEGTLYLADSSAINMIVTLDYDGNYTKKTTHPNTRPEKTSISSGKFTWDNNGTVITLSGESDGERFKVVEGAILLLDKDSADDTTEMCILEQRQ